MVWNWMKNHADREHQNDLLHIDSLRLTRNARDLHSAAKDAGMQILGGALDLEEEVAVAAEAVR